MIPCSVLRGGTSKGIFFLSKHLPSLQSDLKECNEIIQRAMGVPDPSGMQLNGMGGGISSTSKVCIISPSAISGYHLDYQFGQVDMKSGDIDWVGTCGNLASAVYLFALTERLIDESLPIVNVRCVTPMGSSPSSFILKPTTVRSIAGVPSTSKGVDVGSRGPALIDLYECLGIPISVILKGNYTVFAREEDLSSENMVQLRHAAARALGQEADSVIVRLSAVSGPKHFTSSSGTLIKSDEMDVFAKITTPGRDWHHAYTASSLANLAAACVLKGTIPNKICQTPMTPGVVRIGHPGGVTNVSAEYNERTGETTLFIPRSARLLMQGYVNTSFL